MKTGLIERVVLAVATLACGCGNDGELSSRGGASAGALAVHEPPFESFDRAPVDRIITYASSLAYAEDRGVSDEQVLSIHSGAPCPDGCTAGPLVALQPQVGANSLTPEELRQGRVIGRLVNRDSVAYDRLNLSAGGVTYLVVIATAASPWTGYLVSTDPARGSQSRIPHPVTTGEPHPGLYKESLARWVWTDSGEDPWISCEPYCCTLESD